MTVDDDRDGVIPFPGGRTRTKESEGELAAGALKSGWLTQGTEALGLQRAADSLLGRQIVPVAGGSAALHLALLAADIDEGAEVVLSGVSSYTTANLVIVAGGRAVFADIEAPDRPFLDAADANRVASPETRAIVMAHEGGYPAPTQGLRRIADDRDLVLIEDCRGALGAVTDTGPVGTTGDLAAFAFGDTPVSGGFVGCSSEELRRRLETLRSTVIPTDEECFSHDCADTMANGYRIDEAAAAAGSQELARLEDGVRRRQAQAAAAADALGAAGLHVCRPPEPEGRPTWRSVMVLADSRLRRDALAATLRRAGLQASVPVAAFLQPPHNARVPRRPLPNSQEFCERGLQIAVVPALAERVATLL